MSGSLKSFLIQSIRRDGRMTFARYMGFCLYHPEFGYYIQERERTGVKGDYFTSADLHPLFARLVARQAARIWDVMGRPVPFAWVEMGAGRGLFAVDFLQWSAVALPEFFTALDYVAIEPGAAQRRRIAERLTEVGCAGKGRLLADLGELAPLTGCFFSNELVDAFPVHVVTRSRGCLKEIYVTVQADELAEEMGPISDPAVAAYVARYAPGVEEGQRIEVNLNAESWMRAVAAKLRRGFVLTIDYGDVASRLFTPERPRGTLLGYIQHRTTEDFLRTPGEMDLTAHVNFSALMDAGRAAGLDVEALTSQEEFLLRLGEANQFADIYDPGQTEMQRLQARLKLKTLISPAGVGRIFKVLVQKNNRIGPDHDWRPPAGD